MNSNQAKIAAAVAKRREKISKVKASSTSSGWVKDTVTKKAHPIITSLRQWMIDASGERNSSRDTEHIHPSEMAKSNWCHRQTFYRISDTPIDVDHKAPQLYWRLASIFEEGHGIHDKHQRGFWEMGVLEGAWECLGCEHRWWATAPAVCESCGGWHIVYREVPLSSPSHHIIGHTDGLHNLDGVRTNLEMKSVGIRSIEMEIPGVYMRWKESGAGIEALWSSIKIPFPSHQRQVQIYMAILQEMGYEVSETFFIYEFKANQDLKGFTVKYDERAAQKLLAKASAVMQARDTGVTPDRPEWAGQKAKDCKECPWKQQCWSSDGVQVEEADEDEYEDAM